MRDYRQIPGSPLIVRDLELDAVLSFPAKYEFMKWQAEAIRNIYQAPYSTPYERCVAGWDTSAIR